MKRIIGSSLVLSAMALTCVAQGIRAVTRQVAISPLPGVNVQWPLPQGVGNAPAAAIPQPALFAPQRISPPGPPIASSEEVARNTLEFQKKRAEAGAAHAQFDLGIRYLNGDRVGKDLTAARKWLKAAAENGHSQAKRKLEELEKVAEQARHQAQASTSQVKLQITD